MADGSGEGSGWKRVQSLFKLSNGSRPPEEIEAWSNAVFVATAFGFLFGGLIGARHSGDKYIAMNHNTKYQHPIQAHREMHGAAALGFLRQGLKWGYKMGAFVALFSGCDILLSVYRNKDDMLNMIASGGVTGLLFRVRYGIKPSIGGMTLGLLVTTPFAVVFHGLDWLLVSEEKRQKRIEQVLEARRKRERTWDDRLDVISEVMDNLDVDDESSTKSLKTYYEVKNSK
ncbi:PREDICTED: complex I assembly factor TIMMDC1, mitochondrial-like [Amphimedon queenslandica]|uniref:Complex I assembly factor TIMMDC1, mitochondrial n=1 Tax=Amphimedon queenslandica TaxID=400682 RepID=A0A1X7UWI7_AMPQE|nr:PREDICTED: complex I assembly factor TIMMDC1, mitochondrial-like [Amphimedon queenslandica]|eukprot:XP_011403934.1 PREDICTED: complex I assembly factor TIMMDC1, mitochondrial-like [Amphimedon queenslandica]